MYKLGRNSLRNRQGVTDNLIAVGNLAIQLTPIDFGYPQYSGLSKRIIKLGQIMYSNERVFQNEA